MRIATAGAATFEVAVPPGAATVLEEEARPEIPFPADVTGSMVWRGDGASITSKNGFTMDRSLRAP